MESTQRLNIRMLFQMPRRWTSKHLEALNLREYYDVEPADIVGEANLPSKDDDSFQGLASEFEEPTREEIFRSILLEQRHEDNGFIMMFRYLRSAALDYQGGHSRNLYLDVIMDDFLVLAQYNKSFDTSCAEQRVPFTFSSCKVRGKLICDGAIIKNSELGDTSPLVLFSFSPGPDNVNPAKEVAYLLFQAILAYERDPSLENYATFVIGMKGASFEIVKGVVSRSYLQSLLLKRRPREHFDIYRSKSYDLVEQGNRSEFLGLIMGLFKYLSGAWPD